MRVRELRAIAGLELAEVLRSRWIVFCFLVYGLLAGLFVLVGLRESSVLGFTGMGRVLLGLSHALVLLLPLIGLLASGQTVNRARAEGALELLFSHPLGRGSYLLAVGGVRYLALTLPLLVLLPGLAVLGAVRYGQPIPWGFLGRALGVSSALLFASVATGLFITVHVRDQARALMLLLLTWAAGAALLDFALVGVLLEWRLEPRAVFALASANPVQAARMALLSGAEPELSTLGPVGFYLANRIGAGGLLAVGVLWPAALGAGLGVAAALRFRRGDLL